MSRGWRFLAALLILSSWSCSDNDQTGVLDAGLDRGEEAAVDAGSDSSKDGSSDAHGDSAQDASADAGLDRGQEGAADAGRDVSGDVAAKDAPADRARDVPPDSGMDMGQEASVDAGSDAPGDASKDTAADWGKDASPDLKSDILGDTGEPDALSTPGYVSIPAGTFLMGSPPSEPCRYSNEDQHQVTLTHGFEISDHEVTQGDFLALMGYNPSYITSCGASCPVEEVSWHEAAAYCNALSAQQGLAACYTCSGSGASVTCAEASAYSGKNVYSCPGYRLPTEAEWEYAYRAGTTTAYYNGPNDSTKCYLCSDANADAIGWYYCNSGSTTHPAKQKLANVWGLYDMAGNVWEWCHDWYKSNLGSSAVADPVGSGSSVRVVRGGSWDFIASSLRSANRGGDPPSSRGDNLGFRCSRTKKP